MRATWRLLAGNRDLRLLFGAGLISMTGDWILRIGLVYYVYALTSSTMASALAMLASFVPQVLLGSVAGIFVDRWDRRRTMVVSNLLLAAGLLPLLLVDDASRVWIAYAVLFWEGLVAQFFIPAEQALIPSLVDDAQLVGANAVNGQVRDLSRLVGSAVGGVAAAVGGLAGVALMDAASFVISAALIGLMGTRKVAAPSPTAEPATDAFVHRVAALRREWADGMRLLSRHRVLRLLTWFVLVTAIGEGIMSTLFAPFVRSVLHGGSGAYGIVVAVQAIGGLIGGLCAVSLAQRVSAARMVGVGSVLFGLVDLAIFLYPLGYVAVWPAAVGMIIVGLPGAISIAGLMTLFQRNTADSHRGRVFGALGAAEGVAVLLGTAAAGWLGEAIGIVPVLAVQGAGYVVAGFAVLVLMRRSPDGTPQVPLGDTPARAELVSAAAAVGARDDL
ncbi:MAG: MFS transporter [Actinomycetes bacterium]